MLEIIITIFLAPLVVNILTTLFDNTQPPIFQAFVLIFPQSVFVV